MENRREYMTRECCSALHYLHRLFQDVDSYFSNGYLNSEGLKLLNKALEVIVEYCPSYSAMARKARKTMLLEDVEKLYSTLLDVCSETT